MSDIIRSKRSKRKAIRVKSYGRLYAFLVLLIIVALALLFNSRIFDVAQVTVYGAENFSHEQIIAMSGITPETNILKLDEPKVKANIELNPYIEVLDIIRKIPDKVEIYIEERKPAVQFEYYGSYVNADKKGNALSIEQVQNPTYILIKGLVLREIALGKKAESIDEELTQTYQQLLNLLQTHGLIADTEAIDLSLKNDIRLYLRDGFLIKLGTSLSLDKKFTLINPAMKEVKAQGNTGGTLDLSVEDKAFFQPVNTPTPTPLETATPTPGETSTPTPAPEQTSTITPEPTESN